MSVHYSLNFQELGITALHIKICATGATRPGAQSALRALARSGMKIGRIGKFDSLQILLKNVDVLFSILLFFWAV